MTGENFSKGAGPASGRLAGARAWLITDGKAGMDVQAKGVADALRLDVEWRRVEPTRAYRVLSPWGPVARSEGIGRSGGRFGPPWPDVAIATGRMAIPYVRALKRHAGLATFTVVLQDPRTGCGTADFIWVPEHDRLRGPNVFTTTTAPHSFSAARLTELRANVPPPIAALPGPRVAVVLGGKNGVYKFTDACDDRFKAALRSVAALGASFMITPSRRTHPRLLAAVDDATAASPRILWDGEGPNPYPDFLAQADLLIVTADSVNMTSEASATGKPVLVFRPQGGSPKFDRFHAALQARGATRPLPDHLATVPQWHYEPIDAALEIAAAIEKRVARRRQMLAAGEAAE
jgi:mitochondrial fission protein ELM1